MPITIKNSAGGGVTLDSTTSSNETLNLPSGGGTLAPLASPVFTGNVGIGAGTALSPLDVKSGFITVSKDANTAGRIGASEYITGSTANDLIVQATGSGVTKLYQSGVNSLNIDASGNVLMGGMTSLGSTKGLSFQNNSGYGQLNLKKTVSDTVIAVNFYHNNSVVGSIKYSNTATQYVTSSDYRLKENVTPMSGATAQTKLLKPCNFDWIAGGNVNGFIAHELADVVPEAVSGTKDAMRDEEYEVTAATDTEAAVMGTRSVPDLQGIDQSKLVPLLTATIQELITRIEALENV